MAVMALLSVVLLQMLSAASQTWILGQARVNNFTKGRAMLDLLARDIQAGLYRDDLPAFPVDRIAFYTERPGFAVGGGAVRNVSWVEYELGAADTATLQRIDQAMDWHDTPAFGSQIAPTGPSVPRETAPGVIGFAVQFIDSDGVISNAPATDHSPRAISIGLAVVDDSTFDRLSTAQVNALRAAFAAHVSETRSVKADWEHYINTSLDWSTYPSSLATGLKVFERYVLLP